MLALSVQVAPPVDVALVLAVDVSLSMDQEEQLAQRDGYAAAVDEHFGEFRSHPVVERALASTRTFRIGATGLLYHQLLPTILAQRITGGEAVRQWARLCRELGETPPGPPAVVDGLRLPPAATSLPRWIIWELRGLRA